MLKLDIIKTALFTPNADGNWGLPLILWSDPGKAKSAVLAQIAKAFGMRLKVLPPGQMGEGVFGVTPYPVKTERGVRMTFPAPGWIDEFYAADGSELAGIVFPDETNTAPPALQAAVMGMINDRRVGDAYLPKRVRVLGAANPTVTSAGGWDLSAPAANRNGHIDWDGATVEEWADYMVGAMHGCTPVDAAVEEKRVLGVWDGEWAKAAGMVSAFVTRNSKHYHNMPASGDPQQSRAWSSPRTLELATRALAGASIHSLDESDTQELFAAFVGKGCCKEFIAWRKKLDLPDPAALLDGKVKFAHDPSRLDRTFATLASCVTLVTPPNADKRQERAKKLWTIMAEVAVDAADVIVPTVRALAKPRLGTASPEARPVLATLAPMLAAAGITVKE
jgi:hypothetical protein